MCVTFLKAGHFTLKDVNWLKNPCTYETIYLTCMYTSPLEMKSDYSND